MPCISGAALMEQDFVPAEFVVKGWLPKGLCILGGAPKVGKSWLVLDLCLHVAKGEPFLGMEVTQGTAWYLSLEDNNDRLRQRIACITPDVPDTIQLTSQEHTPGTMADGLPGVIDNFMRKFPDTKLIVIDTMQLARPLSKLGRPKLYFEFPIGFDEALEYKKAHGQYLRRNQWQDLTVHVYI